jgi:RNA polymerase sigma factor (sigma-70 family)
MGQRATQTVLRQLRKLVGEPGMSQRSDQQLLQQFISQHDEGAFAELLRRHGPMVLDAARCVLHDRHDAEDVYQATFLVLARKAASIRKQASLASWLYGVAYRLAMKARTSANKRRTRERQSVPKDQTSVLDEMSWREFRLILHEELQRLPDKYRSPLLLCYFEGATQDEAAEQLLWNKWTLKDRLDRARDLLRTRLTRRGVIPSTALFAALLARDAASAVPAAVLDSLAHACSLVAAGQPTATAVSAQAAGLADHAIRGIAFTKAKLAVAMILAFGMIAAGAGLATYQACKDDPPQEKKEVKLNLLAKDEVPSKQSKERPQRTDLSGDPLPEEAVARLGTVRFNHGDGLNTLYFSPDGRTIMSEGGGSLRLWDAATGKELRQFITAKPSFDDQTALSTDGKTMTFLNQDFNDTVRVWDLARGKEVRTTPLPVQRNEMSVFRRNALSRDGLLCALHTPKQIQVFDIATARELYKLPNEGDEIRAVIFAGTDRLVTADKQQVIRVWEARTGEPLRQFAHDSPVEVLTSSADGRWLATLQHHNHAIDRLLESDVVQVWDLTTGARKHTLVARPKRWFMKVQFAPDGKFLFTSSFGHNGNELTVWDLETGQRVRELGGVAATAIAVSPDRNRLAEGALPGKFHLWDLRTGRRLSSEDSGHARAAAVSLSSGGDRVFTIGNSSISAWDATTGQRLHSLDVPRYPYGDPHPSHSPDGRYALSFEGDYEKLQILLWDVVARRRLHTLRPPGAFGALATAFSGDSSLLAAWLPGKETVVRLWNVRTGQEVQSFKETKAGWPGRLFFTADGRTLFVAGKHMVGYDAASGKELYSWRMKPLPSNSGEKAAVGGPIANADDRIAWRTLALSPEGSTVACILAGGDFSQERVENRIVLCEARTGKVLRRCNDSGKPSPSSLEQLNFSHDGRLLASSDGHIVHLWEVATGKEIRTYEGHRGDIESLAFSANGRRLASASSDSTVLIWNLVSMLRPTDALVEQPDEKELGTWWADLAANDAARAYAAVWLLAEAQSVSVPFLRERLKPVPNTQVKEILQHIDDLDNNSFAVREKAFQELRSLGPAAAPALRQALEKKTSLETRRHVEELVESLNGPISGESLRTLRALAVLEHAGTPEARRLLEALAGGASGAWLTQEAKASVERLAKQPK